MSDDVPRQAETRDAAETRAEADMPKAPLSPAGQRAMQGADTAPAGAGDTPPRAETEQGLGALKETGAERANEASDYDAVARANAEGRAGRAGAETQAPPPPKKETFQGGGGPERGY